MFSIEIRYKTCNSEFLAIIKILKPGNIILKAADIRSLSLLTIAIAVNSLT